MRTYSRNPKGKQQVRDKERWGRTEYFCPNCGKQKVWKQLDEGDYYVGEDHICTACQKMFTWQNEMNMNKERTPQLVKQLS